MTDGSSFAPSHSPQSSMSGGATGLPQKGDSVNLKRTVSMKEENDTSRIRKGSTKTSPRFASDPVSRMVDEAAAGVATNDSSTSPSSSELSSSRGSLDSSMRDIDEQVRKVFDVVWHRSDSFCVTDNFPTIDKVVTPQVFKKIEKEERKQQNVLLEFLNSEKKQTYNLKLITWFLPPADLAAVERLMDFHFSFYLRMLQCVNSDMLIKNVGKVFVEVFGSPDYCNRFVEYYKWTLGKNFKGEQIRKQEEQWRVQLEKRSLQDLVASEVQRATKYKLLMESVMKYSSHCNEDERKHLVSALQFVTELIAQVDEEKGLQDYLAIVSKVEGDIPAEIGLMSKPKMYTINYALVKYMAKRQGEQKQVKFLKNYLVIVLEKYMVLIERDPSTDKLTWKRFLDPDKNIPSVIKRLDMVHVTVDSTRPLVGDQLELVKKQDNNVLCMCMSFQLMVFLSTKEQRINWANDLKKWIPQFPLKNQPKENPADGNSQPPATDAESFNFESEVNYDKVPDDTTSVGSSILQRSDSDLAFDQRLIRIGELRTQVISLLKESFDLARSVYDPNNSLQPESLSKSFDSVVTEQLVCLIDKEQWLRNVDTPLVSLAGHLDALAASSVNRVEFYLNNGEGKSKTLQAKITEQDGVGVAEVPGNFKVFSDQSDEANEVHLQKPDAVALFKYTNRIHQKVGILDSQIGNDSAEMEFDDGYAELGPCEEDVEDGNSNECHLEDLEENHTLVLNDAEKLRGETATDVPSMVVQEATSSLSNSSASTVLINAATEAHSSTADESLNESFEFENVASRSQEIDSESALSPMVFVEKVETNSAENPPEAENGLGLNEEFFHDAQSENLSEFENVDVAPTEST